MPGRRSEPPPPISYRDYLIWTASIVAESMNEAITKALRMRNEAAAEELLEHRLRAVVDLSVFDYFNKDMVLPPVREEH